MVIDIRSDKHFEDLKDRVVWGLRQGKGNKVLPSELLYDELGLQLYERIMEAEEYYLVNAERSIMRDRMDEIMEFIPDGATLIELGAGSLWKTKLILDAVDKYRSGVCYYALDLVKKELQRSLKNLGNYENITTYGLWGTYQDGLKYIQKTPAGACRVVLWLGLSIDNFDREDAKAFMKEVENSLVPGDCMLLGIDLMNPKRIALAYDSPKGVNKDFMMNGLVHCDRILGEGVIDPSDFSYISQVDIYDGFHKSSYRCNRQLYLPEYKIELDKGEDILAIYSFKYSCNEIQALLKGCGMKCMKQWLDSSSLYTLNVALKLTTLSKHAPILFQGQDGSVNHINLPVAH